MRLLLTFSNPQNIPMAAALGNKKVAQKLSNIAHSWIVDPFRPNLQLKTFLESLAAHPRLTPQAVTAARALQDNRMANKVSSSISTEIFFVDQNLILRQYPLSDKMLHPPSMPHHYDRLVEAFEKSAQGVGRPWWKVFFNVW